MRVQCGVMHSFSASLRGQSLDILGESGHSRYHFKMVAFTVSYYSDQALENHVEIMEKQQQNPKQKNKQNKTKKTHTLLPKKQSKATQKIQATLQMISFL